MRLLVLMIMLIVTGCAATPSVSEQGFLGQSGWQHEQAVQDAEIITQGMNRARAESERFAKQP